MAESSETLIKVLAIALIAIVGLQLLSSLARLCGLRQVPYFEVIPMPQGVRRALGRPQANVTMWGSARTDVGGNVGRVSLDKFNISTTGAAGPMREQFNVQTGEHVGASRYEYMQDTARLAAPHAQGSSFVGPRLLSMKDMVAPQQNGSMQPPPTFKTCPVDDPTCQNTGGVKGVKYMKLSDYAQTPAAAPQGAQKPQGCGSCGMEPTVALGRPRFCSATDPMCVSQGANKPRFCDASDPKCGSSSQGSVVAQGKPLVKFGKTSIKAGRKKHLGTPLGAALSPSGKKEHLAARQMPSLGASKYKFLTGVEGRGEIIYYDQNQLDRLSRDGTLITK